MITPLSIRNLTVAYQKKPVLENVTFDIPEGNLIGIIGPNGGGNQHLLRRSWN